MKKILPFILANAFFITVVAQSPALIWAGSAKSDVAAFGEPSNSPSAIVTDDANNLYTIGHYEGTVNFNLNGGNNTLTTAQTRQTFISKYDAGGNFLWVKSLGDGGSVDAYTMVVDGNHLLISGAYTGTIDFDPGPGTVNLAGSNLTNCFVAEFDTDGNLVTAFSVGGTRLTYSVAISHDQDHNIYIAGSFSGTVDFDPGASTTNITSAGANDGFIAKYSAAGALIWVKTIGKNENEDIDDMVIDPSGNIYVSGTFSSKTIDLDGGTTVFKRTGKYDCFLAKYNSNGAFIWADHISGIGGSSVTGRSLAADLNGVYMTGNFEKTVDFDGSAAKASLIAGDNTDLFLARYTSSGAYGWAVNVHGTGADGANCVTSDAAGNAYITGYLGNGEIDLDPGPGTVTVNGEGVLI